MTSPEEGDDDPSTSDHPAGPPHEAGGCPRPRYAGQVGCAGLPGHALRGRAEDLAVQADLAAMGVRDELREELAAAENAWLAARGRLDEAAEEAQHAVDDLRGALKKVIADVAGAQRAADAAIRRTRAHR